MPIRNGSDGKNRDMDERTRITGARVHAFDLLSGREAMMGLRLRVIEWT